MIDFQGQCNRLSTSVLRGMNKTKAVCDSHRKQLLTLSQQTSNKSFETSLPLCRFYMIRWIELNKLQINDF